MYRGSGNSNDALRLLFQASDALPGRFLKDCWRVDDACSVLCLPSGLPVPDGPDSVLMKNFNNDATTGPFLRAFGVKKKT